MVNVNNNCATGSSALWLARQAVASGAADCVLAFGFEQMRRGALTSVWDGPARPVRGLPRRSLSTQHGPSEAPMAARATSAAPARPTPSATARGPRRSPQIAVKSRRHAANNPYAVFRDPVTVEEVLDVAARSSAR